MRTLPDGQVVFEIKGDNSGIKTALSETTTEITKETSKWDTSVTGASDTMSSSLIGAFKAVAGSAAFVQVARMLADLGMQSIQLASDLEEVQNVVDVTFGSGADKVGEWAKNAASQFGLTELQAKKYASTLGAMFKSGGIDDSQVMEMSTSLAGLAADMASFYNLDFDTAFTKIQSAMAGLSMPMRQLGIDMTDTAMAAFVMEHDYAKTWGKMSEQEQTMVRYAALMEKTAGAQGDFVRTSDSFANSQRRMQTGFDTLKAQLGQALLPIATTLTNAVNDLLDVLTWQPPETAFDKAEESMADAAGTAARAQGILGYMDSLYEKYGDAATKSDEWAQALEKLKTVMPEVNQFIDDETGALTATNEQLREYIENSKNAALEDARKKALGELSTAYTQAGQSYYTAEINRDMAAATAEAARQSLIDYIAGHAGKEGFTGEGMDMKQLAFAARQTANEFGESQTVIEEWTKLYEDNIASVDKYQREMDTLSLQMETAKADLEIAQQALDRMAAAARTAADNLNSVPSTGMNSGQYYNWFYGGMHSHAAGLDYVPYDGYFAVLHKGERVQTAAEANLARQYSGMMPGLDYSTIGSALWSNAPSMGGNVYLDGRTVGRVISDMQGKSYRTLERSGWQQ